MRFDPNAYGKQLPEILALDGNGERLMPLAQGSCSSEQARQRLKAAAAAALFPRARAAAAAFAGLWLYFSCWDEAHQIAQDIETREGSYWHAIIHRQEPDAGNAGYWFRQTGAHPIFPELHKCAQAIGIDFGARWDPIGFVDLCERARANPESDLERQAMRVQTVEWQLLFDYCAAG